jgi:hypothetical protein
MRSEQVAAHPKRPVQRLPGPSLGRGEDQDGLTRRAAT